jgi:hypothetical protein
MEKEVNASPGRVTRWRRWRERRKRAAREGRARAEERLNKERHNYQGGGAQADRAEVTEEAALA